MIGRRNSDINSINIEEKYLHTFIEKLLSHVPINMWVFFFRGKAMGALKKHQSTSGACRFKSSFQVIFNIR